MQPFKQWIVFRYIVTELFPAFSLGTIVFVAIIMTFQAFRLSELLLVHGAEFGLVSRLVLYLSISFLPIVLPMSLLFSTLLVFGRMSQDSEIIAFKSIGLPLWRLIIGPTLFSILIGYLSWDLSFTIAPWANRKMELLVHNLSQVKPEANIKAGVFSEGFFDMVIYTNKIDNDTGVLRDIFIFDERNENSPLTIIAKEGKMHRSKNLFGQSGFLRLKDGNVHRSETRDKVYTKLDFDTYDLYLYEANPNEIKRKSLLSYNKEDLENAIKDPELPHKRAVQVEIELERRSSLAVACVFLTLLAMGLGTSTNRRSGQGGGLVLSLIVIVAYWVTYIAMENAAKSEVLPVIVAIWIPNFAVGGLAVQRLIKAAI